MASVRVESYAAGDRFYTDARVVVAQAGHLFVYKKDSQTLLMEWPAGEWAKAEVFS